MNQKNSSLPDLVPQWYYNTLDSNLHKELVALNNEERKYIMNRYLSLLRGINVSGQKKITMEQLKTLYEELGFKDVKTYIQSGNVFFSTKKESKREIAKAIEHKIKESLGYEVTLFVIEKSQLKDIIAMNPYPVREPKRHLVTLLSAPPELIPIPEINAVKAPSEKFTIIETVLFFYCPDGYGKTKLSNNFFEKKLKVKATTRNWNTINKLFEMF